MPDIRQNFNLPYPIVSKIIEKVNVDDVYKLSNTCKFMQRMCYRQSITNFPQKLVKSIVKNLTPLQLFDLAHASPFLWEITKEIRKRPVNALSIVDDGSTTECYTSEEDHKLGLSLNYDDFEEIVDNLVITDKLEIGFSKFFKISLKDSLRIPNLQFTTLDLTDSQLSKADMQYFLHENLQVFFTDHVYINPPIKFEELLDMTKNITEMRIDIPNLKTSPKIAEIALAWDRTKPLKSFQFMRLPKLFTVPTCIEFIEKFGDTHSEFSLSFSKSNSGFHEKFQQKIRAAIDEAVQAPNSTNKGLAGVANFRCAVLEY